ncbi:uncharacterized protein GGS22DRAFT_186564 [Annulohypoxylon maeteangense]|uniref:uncharacterized protein n=1 Tax=Annulohypoxylon maeteangense TaxID=1927788 RepID=UPI002008CFDA|nr:uncharacterized protein GGS22DRAFT_186564 [Annulohypoxylon maeteangense]KAI0886492.1 hypothetical protein GGS22DRAFT_186564 [Annulohypoxylon maeteangense]
MFNLQSPLWLVVWASTARLASAIADDRPNMTVVPRATAVVNAVIPTTTGQIGVTPVEDDIGDPDIYRGTIQHLTASQSSLITTQSGTTRWLAKHIDFLTETTSQGTTKTVQLSVATAAAAVGSVAVGDVTVVLAEGLAGKLAQAADAAVKACNALGAKRDSIAPDDVLSCLLNKGTDAYADNGVFSIVNAAEWNSIIVDAAPKAVPLVKGAFQVAKTQARKAMLALFMSAVSINLSQAAGAAVVVGAIVLPKVGFGTPTETKDDNKCPAALKTKNSESPICTDLDCLGDKTTELCTVGGNKGCPCLLEAKNIIASIDTAFLNFQGPYLKSIAAMPDPSPPKTIQTADPITVNAPKPTPTCGSNGKATPSVTFDVKIPNGKDGILVNLPIANQPGSWSVSFDKTDSIAFYQIDAGATKFVPITNGKGAPPNNKIEWTVPDGKPTVNTKLSLNFNKGNIAIKGTITGQQKCTPPPTTTPSTGTPNSSQCINDCGTIVSQLMASYGDTIDVTNDKDRSKFVDFATGRNNPLDNDWWRISSHGNCFLMIGKDASHRGFSDFPPAVKRQDLINFINQRKLFACINAHPMLVATPPTFFSNTIGSSQICLTDFANYQKCTGHVAPPS